MHPNKKQLFYPLGSTIVIREISSPNNQNFLQGHSDKVTCLALSPSGRYLASGQVTHMGFQASVMFWILVCARAQPFLLHQADVIVWDVESRQMLHRLRLHKVKVQALAFSCNELFLASLGGQVGLFKSLEFHVNARSTCLFQDDNNLVIWDVETGKVTLQEVLPVHELTFCFLQAVCGSPASNENATTVTFCRHTDYGLVTAGNYTLRVWEFDRPNRKVRRSPTRIGF